jgi:peptidoglycan/LPS O-acetylase OafA/YrhL
VQFSAALLVVGWLAVSLYTYLIAYAIIAGFDYTTYKFTGFWWLLSALLPPLRSIGYGMCIVGLQHGLQGATMALPRYAVITNHVIQALGSMSYSVYVWHFPALYNTFTGNVANNWVGLHANAWRIIFTYAFMIAPLVLLSYRYIEQGSFGNYPQADADLRTLIGWSSLGRAILPDHHLDKP